MLNFSLTSSDVQIDSISKAPTTDDADLKLITDFIIKSYIIDDKLWRGKVFTPQVLGVGDANGFHAIRTLS